MSNLLERLDILNWEEEPFVTDLGVTYPLSAKATAVCNNISIALNHCPESGQWFFLNSPTQVDGLSST